MNTFKSFVTWTILTPPKVMQPFFTATADTQSFIKSCWHWMMLTGWPNGNEFNMKWSRWLALTACDHLTSCWCNNAECNGKLHRLYQNGIRRKGISGLIRTCLHPSNVEMHNGIFQVAVYWTARLPIRHGHHWNVHHEKKSNIEPLTKPQIVCIFAKAKPHYKWEAP